MSEENDNRSLVDQLGTSPKRAAKSEWDMRLLSYIISPEKVPESFKPVLYMLTRRDVVSGGKRFWDALADNYLTLMCSVNGKGISNILKAENARHGIAVNTDLPPEKPSLFDRIADRDKVRDYERHLEEQEIERS